MRINHVGEICAQALYTGQALTARSPSTQQKLKKAAREEIDHLHWCQQRIHELNTHVSYLSPFWFIGALFIGLTAGLGGDKLSLGFLAETEHQVERHLQKHLQGHLSISLAQYGSSDFAMALTFILPLSSCFYGKYYPAPIPKVEEVCKTHGAWPVRVSCPATESGIPL